jgi:hypothetical protein
MCKEKRTLHIPDSQHGKNIPVRRRNVLDVVGYINRDKNGAAYKSDGRVK